MEFESAVLKKHNIPVLIGVCGGPASGKMSVCKKIIDSLYNVDSNNVRRVVCISQDSFYKVLNEEEHETALSFKYNFDHPGWFTVDIWGAMCIEAFDYDLMVSTLQAVLRGETVTVPIYDYKSCSSSSTITIQPADVVLVEGILIFSNEELRKIFRLKLFVDSDPDTRLSRRVLKDTKERGRSLDAILDQYINFVKPAFDEFCFPTKKYADVIIPRGVDNVIAINLIVQHIQEILTRYSPRNSTAKPVKLNGTNYASPVPLNVEKSVH